MQFTQAFSWNGVSFYASPSQFTGAASFEEICLAMGELIKSGKIRGWGMCNDNAFGLTACCEVAKRLGVPPPVSMQNDFSMNDRRAEENGVAEVLLSTYRQRETC